jgi:uncharacterized protein (TIGR02246 family)
MKIRRLVILFVTLIAVTTDAQTPRSSPATKGETNANETQIRELYNRWAKAFRAHDIDAIMSIYAPDDALIAYDIVPPLQYLGNAAYRKDYETLLAQYDGPIEIEYRDLRIVAGDDVAFIHALERISGTLRNGQKSDMWIRATSGLRKIKRKWLIVHDHISAPVDLESGKAVLDLKP